MASVFNRFSFEARNLSVVSVYVSPGSGRAYLRLISPDGSLNCSLDNTCTKPAPSEGAVLSAARFSVFNSYNKETGARSCWVALLDYEI